MRDPANTVRISAEKPSTRPRNLAISGGIENRPLTPTAQPLNNQPGRVGERHEFCPLARIFNDCFSGLTLRIKNQAREKLSDLAYWLLQLDSNQQPFD